MVEKIQRLLLPVPEIAAALSVSEVTARRLLRLGHLKKVHIGPRIYGTAESVARIADEGVQKIQRVGPHAVQTIGAASTRKSRARLKKHTDTAREAVEIEA